MASNELIIDDHYCEIMGKYFVSRGVHLEDLIRDYIQILEYIKKNAIISGEVSDALQLYIDYSKKIQNKIKDISESIKRQTDTFLLKIDEADQYLF